jgi:hypothetical protein
MAEWSKRGTVNTFYRGSNPLKAYILIIQIKVLIISIAKYELLIYS